MRMAIVKRPEYNDSLADHPLVKLTASVTHGSVTKEYELPLRVKMQGITDSQAVILDLNDIILPAEARENLNLPVIGKNGSTISWKSNSSTITPAGVVSRPASGQEDEVVTITATATKNGETQTKEFEIKVIAWTTAEELQQAKELITWDLIKGSNTNSQAITSNLVLPNTVGREVQVEWITSSSNLDIETGEITRPSYTQGQVTLDLVATLTHGGSVERVSLPVFIIAPLPMTDLEVMNTAKSLLEANLFLGANESLAKITTNMQLPFRIKDADASRATISWTLATHTAHTPLESHQNISITNAAEYAIATINRPSKIEGNIKVALCATIEVGDGSSKITDTKYFDLTILVQDEAAE